MNKGEMRSVLRRRLQEDIPENWTDTELDSILNEAYFWVQQAWGQINPTALFHIDYTTIEAGKYLYPYARGMTSVHEMAYLDPDDPTGYRDLGPPQPYNLMRQQVRLATTTPSSVSVSWSNLGRHFAIFPIPDTTIANGIQKIWRGTLGLANDTDNPEIPFSHMSIVTKAQLMAYGETGDDIKPIQAELQDYMSGMSMAAEPDNYDGSPKFSVSGVGRGVGLNSRNVRATQP